MSAGCPAAATGADDFATTPARDEYATAVPVGSVALTVTASARPTSARTCTYVPSVAPWIELHFAPTGLQRYHW